MFVSLNSRLASNTEEKEHTFAASWKMTKGRPSSGLESGTDAFPASVTAMALSIRFGHLPVYMCV